MTKPDRQKLIFLIVLLAVLGATIVLGYRMTQPPATAAVQAPPPKTSSNPPAPSDARIRLDLVEKPEPGEDIGKKNLFQYRLPPAPAPQPQHPPTPSNTFPTASNTPPPQTPVRTGPPTPPPPPPINLKYQGFAVVNSGSGTLTAFLGDDSRHYNVTIGDFLLGRYRIVGISDKSVEVEDLEYNRRQTLPLLK